MKKRIISAFIVLLILFVIFFYANSIESNAYYKNDSNNIQLLAQKDRIKVYSFLDDNGVEYIIALGQSDRLTGENSISIIRRYEE